MEEIACPECGLTVFTLVGRKYIESDFSREGAFGGHPFLQKIGFVADSIFCTNCGFPAEGELFEKIKAAII